MFKLIVVVVVGFIIYITMKQIEKTRKMESEIKKQNNKIENLKQEIHSINKDNK